MAAHGAKRNNKNGPQKKKPTRQASLLHKPVIEVRGKLGKAQKSKKRKIKKIGSSTVEFYESKVDDDRERTLRPEATVLNSAPKKLEQEMPKKVRELMKSKQQMAGEAKLSKRQIKAARTQEYKKQLAAADSWFKRPVTSVPKFKKKSGESNRAFYARVEVESNDFTKMAKFENENECKVVENDKGEMEVEKRTRRRQIKNKEYRDKKKIKRLKKDLDNEDYKDFSDLQDHIRFNERIDRPPEDLVAPRKAKERDTKSAKLSSLKFMGLMGGSVSDKKVDPLKSWAYKERIQEERQRAIDRYREMKAKKRTGTLT